MRQILFCLMVVMILLVMTSCDSGNQPTTPPNQSQATEPSQSQTSDRSADYGSYTYSGNFSGQYYLEHYWWKSNTCTIFWNATNGVGNKTLWYRDSQAIFPDSFIDLYYRDKNTGWSYVWFDRLIPDTSYFTKWKTRNIYVGSATVNFKFVLTSSVTWHQFYLKMVQ